MGCVLKLKNQKKSKYSLPKTIVWSYALIKIKGKLKRRLHSPGFERYLNEDKIP